LELLIRRFGLALRVGGLALRASPKKIIKTEVVVTFGESSKWTKGQDSFGCATKTKVGIPWICLFKDRIKRDLFEHPSYRDKAKEGLMLVCIHEVLHTLDRIKHGEPIKIEEEIIKLSSYYKANPHLPIQI
jgi:hypothetical protein